MQVSCGLNFVCISSEFIVILSGFSLGFVMVFGVNPIKRSEQGGGYAG